MRRGAARILASERGGAMGSRGRSIRLRIYFLVAIPLVAMVGLLAYVAGSTVNNAINLDRAPNLINATSLPTANFVKLVQNERTAAVVYLFAPTPANLAAYQAAVKATDADKPAFLTAMNSAGHQEQRDPRRSEGHQYPHRGDQPAADAPWRRHESGRQPAASARGVQPGHPERTQAVPGRSRQSDQRHRGRPGPRPDRDGIGPGSAVRGIRAAFRGPGRAQDDHGGPRGLRRDGRDPAG